LLEAVGVILKRLKTGLSLILKPEMKSETKKAKTNEFTAMIFKNWVKDSCKQFDLEIAEQKARELLRDTDLKSDAYIVRQYAKCKY
jgi:hypothetical protein